MAGGNALSGSFPSTAGAAALEVIELSGNSLRGTLPIELSELRQLPHRERTPVIMLTAKGHATDREQAAELGASDFLTKPFSPKKLLARIDEIFTS